MLGPASMSAPRLTALASAGLLALLAPGGCNVASQPPPGGCRPLGGATGQRGAVVIDSDYQSTNVMLVGWDGAEASPSLLSSGSSPAGLSATLSGDVIAPSEAPAVRGEVVILDRGNSVLTWIDPASCAARTQLALGATRGGKTFTADPYDYLELRGPDRAYALRYNDNPDPAADPADGGGDVLVLDPASSPPRVTARIDLHPFTPPGAPAGTLPSPARMLRWKGREEFVLVLLQNFATREYLDASDSELVAIRTSADAVDPEFPVVTFSGLRNCGAAVGLPDGRVVVSCSGLLRRDAADIIDGAALVVLSPTADGHLAESARLPAAALGGQALGLTSLAWAGGELVLLGLLGNGTVGSPDRWVLVDIARMARLEPPVASSMSPYMLGDVACDTTRSPVVCVGADGETNGGSLRRFELHGQALDELPQPLVRDPFGLPPRSLGAW